MEINSSTANSLIFQIVDNMHDMFRVIDTNKNVVFMNKRMREAFSNYQNKKCYDLLNNGKKCEDCLTQKCLTLDDSFSKDIILHDSFYRVTSTSVISANNIHYSVEIFQDVTEEKKLEQKMLTQYQKMRLDLDFARQVQQNLIPKSQIYGQQLSLALAYIPSEDLGGDMFDIFQINEQFIGFYISDVSGHGVQSSLLTTFLRQIIRGLKQDATCIPFTINDIIANYKALHLEKEQYFSLIYCLFDMKKEEISLVNAGHNCLPILIEKNGNITQITGSGMPICSLLDGFCHQIITRKVAQGDRILLFTDGVSESLDKQSSVSEELLLDLLKENLHLKGQAFTDALLDKVLAATNRLPQDDITMALIEVL